MVCFGVLQQLTNLKFQLFHDVPQSSVLSQALVHQRSVLLASTNHWHWHSSSPLLLLLLLFGQQLMMWVQSYQLSWKVHSGGQEFCGDLVDRYQCSYKIRIKCQLVSAETSWHKYFLVFVPIKCAFRNSRCCRGFSNRLLSITDRLNRKLHLSEVSWTTSWFALIRMNHLHK